MRNWFKALMRVDGMDYDLDVLARDVIYLEGEIENLTGRLAILEARELCKEGTPVDPVKQGELHDSEPKVDTNKPSSPG